MLLIRVLARMDPAEALPGVAAEQLEGFASGRDPTTETEPSGKNDNLNFVLAFVCRFDEADVHVKRWTGLERPWNTSTTWPYPRDSPGTHACPTANSPQAFYHLGGYYQRVRMIMANTAMDTFLPILIEMMRNPPDPNEPLPLSNRLEVAVGVSVPFLVLSLLAVSLRLHTRVNVVRQRGWDDAFVILAAVFNVVAQSTFLGGVKNGIGQHLITILSTLPTAMKWFYVANAAYTSTTVCIKLSLLCQYLRLWTNGSRRQVTIVLIILVALWGSAFQFLAWFPCFPIKGFWNKRMDPPAKCYGFGYRTTDEAKATLLAFAGSNMFLDLLIFMVPLTEYFRPNLKRQQVIALTGLFAVGFIVVLMAVLRLWSGLEYNNRGILMYDYTFWLPKVLIFSCLEVDFAIICASIPIFWPAVKAAWNQITVTKEVIVISESRYEDAHPDDLELGPERSTSLKSNTSTEGLVAGENMDGKSFYIDAQPAQSKTLRIPPAAQALRKSWGGTPLKDQTVSQ